DGEWGLFRSGGLRALPESIAVGSGVWFMRQWNRTELESALREVCEAFSPGPDWGSLASRTGRLIPWEVCLQVRRSRDGNPGSRFRSSRNGRDCRSVYVVPLRIGRPAWVPFGPMLLPTALTDRASSGQ